MFSLTKLHCFLFILTNHLINDSKIKIHVHVTHVHVHALHVHVHALHVHVHGSVPYVFINVLFLMVIYLINVP